MPDLRAILITITLTAASFAGPADAGQQLALVIGNDTYDEVPSLEKARNDARSVAQVLGDIGYEVFLAEDIGRRAMSKALTALETRITGGETVFFYFAGHGYAIEGTNYLLPADVPWAGPNQQGLVRDAAFSVTSLAKRFAEKGATTTILVLDACRDNPFASRATRGLSGSRGLTGFEPSEGTFVLYSAGIGQAALDSLGDADPNPNSVFTRVLLTELTKSGHSLVDIAKSTQLRVRNLAGSAGHSQTPAYYDQIIGDLFLAPEGVVGGESRAVHIVREGQGGILPTMPVERHASLETSPEPIANFSRSNSGWTATISLPEPAIQFGYKIGEDGEWVDGGLLDWLDQRTGRRMPNTILSLQAEQEETTIFVTWRDPRGEQAEIYEIKFEPYAALVADQKKILDDQWSSWVSFGGYDRFGAYMSHLITYRCAIDVVRYSVDDSRLGMVYRVPPCNPDNPHMFPADAENFVIVPSDAQDFNIQLVYVDGTKSKMRTFKVPR